MLDTLRAPEYGETAKVDSAVFCRWAEAALKIYTAVKLNPAGLHAILERIREHPEVTVEIPDRGIYMYDRQTGKVTPGAGACLPDTMIMVRLPEFEGLRAYIHGDDTKSSTSIGIPRAALKFQDE